MNTLFEINHPGQVHLLRHTICELRNRGHKIDVITKDNPLITYLLQVYGIPYIVLGRKGKGIRKKLFHQVLFDFKALRLVYKSRFKLGVGSSITNDHVSFLAPLQSIHLSDDDPDVVPLISKFSYPFSKIILSPDCINFRRYRKKNIGYAGYHELTYLHPKRFHPDLKVISNVSLRPEDTYFVLRFVALKGHHDGGHIGLTLEQKKVIIDMLEKHGRIFITSENKIESQFEKYRLPISPENVHSLMYYATLL